MNMAQEDGIINLVRNLMHDVYYPFSACIWLDAAGRVLELYQFDTAFCYPQWNAPQDADFCFLISNHPDGDMRPSEEDERNYVKLKQDYPSLALKLLIYSEDEGIAQISV